MVPRQTLPTGNARIPRNVGGFVLLDAIIALTILLVLSAIVWPLVARQTNGAQQAALSMNVASLLQSDRRAASMDGRPVGTRIDLDAHFVTGAGGERIEIPQDIEVEVTTSRRCIHGTRQFVIVFSPNGSSCGGAIVFTKNGRSNAVRINWLSGMVDIVDASNP